MGKKTRENVKQVTTEKVPGNRVHPLLAVDGYLFERNKPICGGISYRCRLYKSHGCKVTLHALENGNFQYGCHHHGPNYERICARKIISEAKTMVKENRFISTKEVLASIENKAMTSSLNGAYLGPSSNLKRRLADTRMKVHGHINLGKTKEDLVLPPELHTTSDDRRFLLFDNNQGPNRMIIFASDDALDKLSYCDTWMVDGTFKSCPSMFAQIYTIHGLFHNSVAVPFVYGYLPGKSQNVYKEYFEAVRQKIKEQPKIIISDFELAAIKACKEVFPGATVNGCLFHFTQNIWRRVQATGSNDGNDTNGRTVLDRYRADDADGQKVRQAIRSLGALAFLPEPEVMGGFLELRSQFTPDDDVRIKIMNSFNDTYLGYKWKHVMFPIKFWSVLSRFVDNQPRTNNMKEGWHFRFNSMLPGPHPPMHKSISMIRDEETHWKLEVDKIKGGMVPQKKRKSVETEIRLKNIVAGYDGQDYTTRKDFLNAIQSCLHEFMQVL